MQPCDQEIIKERKKPEKESFHEGKYCCTKMTKNEDRIPNSVSLKFFLMKKSLEFEV